MKTNADSPSKEIYPAPAQKSPNHDSNKEAKTINSYSIKEKPDKVRQQKKILEIPLVLGPKQAISPQSFKPLVAFNGLYIATSGRYDDKLEVELCTKSQTGLIAQPYIPAFDMTSVSSDDHDCLFGSCCERSRFTSSSGFETPSDYPGRLDRYESSKDFEFVSEKVSRDIIQTGVIKAPKKNLVGESEDVESGDDGTLLNNRTTNFRDEESRDDILHESTTSDDSGNASPPQNEPSARQTQMFRPPSSSKKVYGGFSLGCSDKDPIGRSVLPCIYGKHYNLLTDSLRVIAQHSDIESDEPKNIRLMLPFGRSRKNSCDEAVDILRDTAISSEIIQSSDISRSQYLCPGTYSPPHFESHYTRQISLAEDPVIGLSSNCDNIGSSKNNYTNKDCGVVKIRRCRGKDCITALANHDAISSNKNSDHNKYMQTLSSNTATTTLERLLHEATNKTGNCKRLLRPVKFMKKIDKKKKKGINDNITAYWMSNRSSIIIALAGFLLNHMVAKEVILAMSGIITFVLTIALRILVVLISVIIIKISHHIERPKGTVT